MKGYRNPDADTFNSVFKRAVKNQNESLKLFDSITFERKVYLRSDSLMGISEAVKKK